MKIIDKWKAQTDWEKAASIHYLVAIVFTTIGFLGDSDFHLLIGVIVLMTTGIIQTAVVEIKRYIYECFSSLRLEVSEVPIENNNSR